MATAVQYDRVPVTSTSNKVSYYINNAPTDIKIGILVTSTIDVDIVSIELYDLDMNIVVNNTYTIVNDTTNVTNNYSDDLRLTQNKNTGALVYAKTSVDSNGQITTTYINMIDGSPYTGNTSDLEIYGDSVVSTDSQVVCVNGTTTLTRKDFVDKHNAIVAMVWQDLAGNVVAAPLSTDTLTAGSCALALDIELIERVDNLLTSAGDVSGKYICFAYANVFSSAGNIALTKTLLPDGRSPYSPTGVVTKEPILPEIVQNILRIDSSNPSFSSDPNTVSIALATEFTNKNNSIDVKHPNMANALPLDRPGTYSLSYGLNRDDDPCLPGIMFTATGVKASALITLQIQPPCEEVVPPSVISGGGGNVGGGIS